MEIGYGLEKQYENRGYMTEAVRALCSWVQQQPGILHITAETDADNPASQRILEKAGFRRCKSGATQWWKL
nr:GNAT family N-acetyltransferase [uncultured Alistipes sp.]